MILNKSESDNRIRELNLNKMLEGVFTNNEDGKLNAFLKEHVCDFYNIRDKAKSSGKFLYNLTAEEVIKYSKNYKKFSVYESLYKADERLILQGEICLTSEFELLASLSDIKSISNREAMCVPKYNISADLKYRKEPYIFGLKQVIDYVVLHNLFDVYIEFSLYDVLVGINKESIIIWELRNY